MAVQAEEAAPAVAAVRRKRRGQLGWVGGIAVTGASLAALYLVMAPLLALLATAFRGPSDLLPFEPGAHWTVSNLVDVYVGRLRRKLAGAGMPGCITTVRHGGYRFNAG